jgi:hypothetical protein
LKDKVHMTELAPFHIESSGFLALHRNLIERGRESSALMLALKNSEIRAIRADPAVGLPTYSAANFAKQVLGQLDDDVIRLGRQTRSGTAPADKLDTR